MGHQSFFVFMFLLGPGKGVDAVVDIVEAEKPRIDQAHPQFEIVFSQGIGS